MSTSADTTAPKLSSLKIPDRVDLGSGPAGLTILAQASDDISGIKNVQVWFDKGFTYSFSLGGDTVSSYRYLVNAGIYDSWDDHGSAQTWWVAQTNSSGLYKVSYVVVEDLQGNTMRYSENDLKEMGVNTVIEFVNSTADSTPPKLTSLSIPSSVNLAAGVAPLTITASATDDNSGVKNVQVVFDKDITYSFGMSDNSNVKYNFLLNSGIEDSWLDGKSTQTWGVAATNASGNYNVIRVVVEDMQGNIKTYSAAELSSLGINTVVNFAGSTPDVTAPQLVSLELPSKIDLSLGEAGFTATAAATDDNAGVKNIQIWFDKNFTYSYALGDGSNANYAFLLNSGVYDSWSDGLSAQTWGIAGTNVPGIYSVIRVVVEDLQGNTRSYSTDELISMGVNTYVEFVDKKIILSSGDDYFLGGQLADIVLGKEGHDKIFGLAGDDYLDGGAGNDILDGGVGADTMIGGAGNDMFYVDNRKDVVIEDVNGGIDTVVSSVSRTLGVNQENLTLVGVAALNGTGNNLNNTLTGNSADNVLNGGSGGDTMVGGLGNDTYHVDSGKDIVIEGDDGGIDTVISSVSRTLGDHQEKLVLTGVMALNGTGNSLDNTLTGNVGDNVLNGGGGADIMIGGTGDDTYHVDSGRDVVIEKPDGGIDTIISSVSRTLGDNQENITLVGGAPLNATGNSLDNRLTGNAGDNILIGGAGNDVLIGGAGDDRLIGGMGKDVLVGGSGKDVFDFDRPTESGLTRLDWDIITDFERGHDKIDLSTIDANTSTALNDAFHAMMLGGERFTAAGQLKFENGVLYGNTDADMDAEFAIQVLGVTKLTLSDFVL